MNNRREFFRKAGVFGALAVAPVATTVAVSLQKEEKAAEDISHLQPESPMTFTLMGNPKPVEKPTNSGAGLYIAPSHPQYQNQVHLSVGKDDRLWIKVGDSWKRVAVES